MTSDPARPARRRPTTWFALGSLAVALGMVAFVWSSMVLPGWEELESRPISLQELATRVTQTLAFVTLSTVGALLAIQRPRNPIGWILLLSGIGFASAAFAPEYVGRAITLESDLPAYELVDWLGFAVQGLGFLLLVIWLPLVFPDGRLPGPRWRPLAVGAAVFIACAAAVLLLSGRERPERLLPNPIAPEGVAGELVELLDTLITPFLIALIALAFVSVIVRFRRADEIERQQLKWFLAAIALLVFTVLTIQVTSGDRQGPAAFLAFSCLPIAIGIAVMRYRLYEIDRLISRTIGWGLVTVLLVGAFALLVLGSTAVLEPLTGGDTLAVAGSTLVVVALFAPLRRRVQVVVDRRFDRSHYDGERLLTAFGERLRDEVDLATIRADVLSTVETSVRPSRVGLWLRTPEGER